MYFFPLLIFNLCLIHCYEAFSNCHSRLHCSLRCAFTSIVSCCRALAPGLWASVKVHGSGVQPPGCSAQAQKLWHMGLSAPGHVIFQIRDWTRVSCILQVGFLWHWAINSSKCISKTRFWKHVEMKVYILGTPSKKYIVCLRKYEIVKLPVSSARDQYVFRKFHSLFEWNLVKTVLDSSIYIFFIMNMPFIKAYKY